MDILIVDDEPIFRAGVRAVLTDVPGISIVGEATNARSAFELVDERAPDLVIMDIMLPGMDGIAATREVRRRSRKTKVLVMSGHQTAQDVLAAFRAGALGYALKTESPETLQEAIRRVGRGERYVAPGLEVPAHTLSATEGPPEDVLGCLSEREKEVFRLLVEGHGNRRIARELCISMKTLGTHRQHIYEKLGCHSVAHLMRFAALNGLLRGSAGERANGAGDGSAESHEAAFS